MHNLTSSTSWMAVASAIILVGATYFGPEHQPVTQRPFSSESSATRPALPTTVQARLWQDPLDAGWKLLASKTSGDESAARELLWSEWGKAQMRMERLINKQAPEETLFLPLVLPGSPYPESRERRLRMRFAVQEAMETMGYRPLNYDALDYFPVPVNSKSGKVIQWGTSGLLTEGTAHQNRLSLPESGSYVPVTYEMFRRVGRLDHRSKYEKVIVFWIDDRIIYTGPAPDYSNLDRMAAGIKRWMNYDAVLTISGSDELLAFLRSNDAHLLPSGNRSFKDKASLRYVLSSAPRAQIEKTLERQLESDDDKVATQIARSIPSDNYVLSAIVDELQRRIPEFGQGDEVWLISEQDTFYSQVMTEEFVGIAKARGLNLRVKSKRFLKGIDGNLPEQSATTNEETVRSINNLRELVKSFNESGVARQRLFDRRQIDYLQRAAEEAALGNRGRPPHQRVKAIGILGGDVYDKMLVLEVFRRHFPAVHYFTTDLDAAYLYGAKGGVTRNLIIGSAFDLSPEDTHDEDGFLVRGREQVVFRDSYQTALYHAVCNVLDPETALDQVTIRVYEVGRSRFHRLKTGKRYVWSYPSRLTAEPNRSVQPAALDPSASAPKERAGPQPPSREGIPDAEKPLSLIGGMPMALPILVALGAAINLALVFTAFRLVLAFQESGPDSTTDRSQHGLLTRSLLDGARWVKRRFLAEQRSFFAWAVILLVVICFLMLLLFAPSMFIDDLEPMHWAEGISAWPSILIRMAIFLGGVALLTLSLLQSRKARAKLKAELSARTVTERHLDATGQYTATSIDGPLARDLLKIYLLTVTLMVLLFLFYRLTHEITSGFFTPGRGRWIFFWHEISLVLSLSMLILLVWWAAFRHHRCFTFLIQLRNDLEKERRAEENEPPAKPGPEEKSGGRKTRAKTPNKKRQPGALSVDEIAALQDYAGVSSLTLLPPFAMMVLLLVSRHTIFDGWNIPLILILSLSFMLFILLLSAFQLSGAAQRLKASELSYFQIQGEPTAEKRESARMASIWQTASGPFGTILKQPIIQALVFAAAGFGISFIEPMFRFFGA